MQSNAIAYAVAASLLGLSAYSFAGSDSPKGEPRVGPVDPSRLAAEQTPDGGKPIYVVDNRVDYEKIPLNEDPNTHITARMRADATVALFRIGQFEHRDGKYVMTPTPQTLRKKKNLCPGESFGEQITGAFCSGTLIGPDLVLTAGHCVREASGFSTDPAAADILFVFQYKVDKEYPAGRSTFPERLVRRGVGLASPDSGRLKGNEDWAVVRLDDKVPIGVATPVVQRRTSKINDNQSIYVIGFPSGLPLKYAANSTVRENTDPDFFEANLDTFHGNSGSGVFDEKTHELVGILVRGANDYNTNVTDFYQDQKEACTRPYRCSVKGCFKPSEGKTNVGKPDESLSREQVTRIERVTYKFP